jgi:hypothetical protein
VLDSGLHQLVVGGMKLHQIDTVTVAVVAGEHRFVLIGQKTGLHQWATCKCTVGVDLRLRPSGTESLRPLLQRQVDAVEVGTVQRRWLVGDVMSFGELVQIHEWAPFRSARGCGADEAQ